jgi:alpha-1,3-rhamnosyltransferase
MAQSVSDLPLVSIIIPSFNHAAYVQEGIEAALAQTYPRCELIVVDDASSDGSPSLLSALAETHGFKLIQNEQNRGLNATLQTGLEAASGELISLIASDDRLAPDKIEWQVSYLAEHRLDGVYATGWLLFGDGRAQLIDLSALEPEFEDGSVLQRFYTDDTNGPLLQSALIKRDVLLRLAPERGRYKSDDWVMLIRLLETSRIGFVNRPVFHYRQHDSNSYQNYWKTLPMRLEVISGVTPPELRFRGLANILQSHGLYLYAEGHFWQTSKLLAASVVLDPSLARISRLIVRVVRMVAGKVLRRSS